MNVVRKTIDGFAWLLATLALGIGLVSVSAAIVGWSAYLYQGHSLPSLIWSFSDSRILRQIFELTATVLMMGLVAMGLALRRRVPPARTSMAAFAVRSGWGAVACAGAGAFLLLLLFACRLILFHSV